MGTPEVSGDHSDQAAGIVDQRRGLNRAEPRGDGNFPVRDEIRIGRDIDDDDLSSGTSGLGLSQSCVQDRCQQRVQVRRVLHTPGQLTSRMIAPGSRTLGRARKAKCSPLRTSDSTDTADRRPELAPRI